MKYPDFSDRNTRTGTLGIVAVGALILAAPFIAQAATAEGEPATTEVAAGGVTLRDANGAPLKCTQTSGSDSSEDDTDTWKWDCGDTRIQMRTDAADEDARAEAVTRTYWLVSGGDRVNTDELERPAPGVYAVHRNDISVAAVERGDLTVYVAAPDDAGREIVERLVAEEAK